MDSPEYKTLIKCYSNLESILQQSPNDVVGQLVPLDILSPRDISYLHNEHNENFKKAERIATIVMLQVRHEPQVFHSFIEALKKAGAWTSKVVMELEQMHKALVEESVKLESK